jgi:hypothetical protein
MRAMTRRAAATVSGLALLLAGCSSLQPSAIPQVSAVPTQVQTTDGAFRLVFDLPQTTWRSTDAITGNAELHYSGGGERSLYGSGASLIGFTWTQVGATRHGNWLWTADCANHLISPTAPLSNGLALSAEWAPDDPDASFYAAMDWQRPRLPPGDYLLRAVSSFTEVPCTGQPAPSGATSHDIATPVIPIHVVP